MQYKQAAEFSTTQSCTNVPIHCPLCSNGVSGDPQTIWKYNAIYHLITEHSNGDTPPTVPGELLVRMFTQKREEKALGIPDGKADQYRLQHRIPDSDAIEELARKRSNTVSTTHSDSHITKKNKLGEIVESD